MKQRILCLAMAVMVTLLVGLAFPETVHAATAAADQTCTDFAGLVKQMEEDAAKGGKPAEPGILTNITKYVKDIINTASQDLFEAFTSSSTYQNAVNAAAILMVVIYGVGFMIGVIQASFGEVLKRMLKLGLIFAVISPGGWSFFSETVVQFFNDGTDQLIGEMMAIGTGTTFDPATDSPFTALDAIAKVVLSPEMVIATLGSVFNSGPYGMMVGGLLGFITLGLIQLLIKGLKLYATSFVVRSLLIGVAPIFIVFLLFERTKQLFTGWVNVMVFLSLQPILYFTFISFFLVMLTTATANMMGGNELCWTEFKATAGSQNKISFWRFKPKEGSPSVDEFTWQGSVSCFLNGGNEPDGKTPCKSFPINIVDILSFLILIYVATKFSDVVDKIASELSNAFVNLDPNTKMGLQQSMKAEGRSGGGVNPQASAAQNTGKKR